MTLNHASLHQHILQHLIEVGYAPSIADMAIHFAAAQAELVEALKALQEYHGVVLHPHNYQVWVIHPFANAPTNVWIEPLQSAEASQPEGWWSSCPWCALGAAALLKRDVRITGSLAGKSQQLVVEIIDGQIHVPDKASEKDVFIHFPIPMTQAWDNVTYTCSTMLMFDSEQQVDNWCQCHAMPKGDVQPIEKIWQFAQVWYGNHLNPDWQKWTMDEARALFQRFGLTHPIWHLPAESGRF